MHEEGVGSTFNGHVTWLFICVQALEVTVWGRRALFRPSFQSPKMLHPLLLAWVQREHRDEAVCSPYDRKSSWRIMGQRIASRRTMSRSIASWGPPLTTYFLQVNPHSSVPPPPDSLASCTGCGDLSIPEFPDTSFKDSSASCAGQSLHIWVCIPG